MFFYEGVDGIGISNETRCRNSDTWLYKPMDCAMPLKSQVFKWAREKYDLFGCIDLQVCNPSHWFVRIDKIELNDFIYHSEDENLKFITYEEAENFCIDKLIELIKTKQP
jgi:hypothetical protein